MNYTRLALLVAIATFFGCSTPQQPPPEAGAEPRPLCPSDNLDRCLVLGLMLETGYQGKPDPERAANYYAFGCERGQNEACYNLAVMEVEGRGVESDPDSARARYTAICDAGHAGGCANLGYLTSKGLGGEADEAAATELYEKACELGSSVGCANLADRQIARGKVGDGVEAFSRACKLGNVSACVRHGWAIASDCSASSCDLSDEAELARGTQSACEEGGEPRVCATFAAHLLGATHFEADPKRAAEVARKACDDGDGWACALHAGVVGKGMTGAADHESARASYKRGCDAGFAPACTAGGVQLLEGRGVDRDPATGYSMLATGCEGGDGDACNTLLLLCQQGDETACDAQ